MASLGKIGEVTERMRRGGDGFSFEWNIPDFLSLAGDGGDRYESPPFNFCDGQWFMTIHPYGIPRNPNTGCVNVFLFRLDAGLPKTLNVTLGIRGADGVENKRKRLQELSKDDACCWLKICLRSNLRGQMSRLMQGKALVLALDIKSDMPSIARGVEELQKSLHGLMAGGEDSDVLIKVGDKEFPAHRAILRARSPVFRAMFTHDMVEKQSGKVTMEDCDPESFPAFLEHVYSGSTEIISIENVFSLYTAADKYYLSALKKACTEFVKNNLTVSCFCDAITLSVKYDEEELTECVTEFFNRNALEIFKTAEWKIFLNENTTVLNELLIKAYSK